MHRKINPKAIVFAGDKIKLTGFENVSVDEAHDKTKTRTLAGSNEDQNFIAPELLADASDGKYTNKVDVFGAGMVMVYMATAVDFYAANPEGDWDRNYGMENFESKFENEPKVKELIEQCLPEEREERASGESLA